MKDMEWNREQELLLWSIRVDDGAGQVGQTLLAGDIDWQLVQRMAALHGVLPLLYRRLKGLDVSRVPAATLDTFKTFGLQHTVRNLCIWQRLGRLLALLTAHGIAAVPVKGVVLAQQVYGDVALRHFVDQDILLLNPTELPLAYTALCGAGYRTVEKLTPHMRWSANNIHVWDADILFEIHWSMPEREYGCTLNGKELAARMQQVSIYGQQMPALSMEDTLLLHILHGAKHQWNRLIWIADIAYLLRAVPELDWEALGKRARRLGVRRIMLTSLLLVQQLSGVGYPAQIQAQCAADRAASKLAAYLRGRLFLEEPAATAGFPYFMLRARERLRDKLFYLHCPREGDHHLMHLPLWLFPMYYLIRPVRILGKIAAGHWVQHSGKG